MTEDWPFIRSHYNPMSWLRGGVTVLCYFALTHADARHLGGSQMAGASFLITVHMRQHYTVDDDGGGEASRPWHCAHAAASTLLALF